MFLGGLCKQPVTLNLWSEMNYSFHTAHKYRRTVFFSKPVCDFLVWLFYLITNLFILKSQLHYIGSIAVKAVWNTQSKKQSQHLGETSQVRHLIANRKYKWCLQRNSFSKHFKENMSDSLSRIQPWKMFCSQRFRNEIWKEPGKAILGRILWLKLNEHKFMNEGHFSEKFF